jgi:muramoyltetrapeptide carboxypeptidase
MTRLCLFSPSGVSVKAAPLRLALRACVRWASTLTSTPTRCSAISVLPVTTMCGWPRCTASRARRRLSRWPRGGYGLTRLLDRIDWPLLARSVDAGTRWVGHSDITALHLGLLAHGGARSWAGPMASEDFGRSDDAGGVDDVTAACFCEAMDGELEAVGFRTEAGFDGLQCKGRLWGGNLTVLLSLLGTPHWPRIKGGVLFLEDVNEQPYRVERMLLQLHQAGVLAAQKAVLLGDFTVQSKSPLDRGYTLRVAVEQLRSVCKTPILSGLPFGHVPTKVTLPVGAPVQLAVQGREVFVGW